MLRAPTKQEEQGLLEQVYPRMVRCLFCIVRIITDFKRAQMDLIISRLSPLEQTSIYYRSTSPGHPQCKSKKVPYKDIHDAHVQEQNLVQRLQEDGEQDYEDKIMHSRWDWDLFQTHNKLWERRIRSMAQRRPLGDKGAKWFYFDIFDLSLQRPDAHHTTSGDCLHCEFFFRFANPSLH